MRGISELLLNRLADVRVEMDRIHDFDLLGSGQFFQGGADVLKRCSKILAPVGGHQDQLPFSGAICLAGVDIQLTQQPVDFIWDGFRSWSKTIRVAAFCKTSMASS